MMSLDTERVLVLMFGVMLGIFVILLVASRWKKMVYSERMFSMSYAGIIIAPLVGVLERLQHDEGFWWADEVILVSLAWSLIGIVATVNNQRRGEHKCPECGTMHYIGPGILMVDAEAEKGGE